MEPSFSDALEAGWRLLSEDDYRERIAWHRERAKRKAIAVMTLISVGAILFVVAIATIAARGT